MGLSPEERRKIYEEEKARIEAREHLEREKRAASSETTTGLTPNIASMLCYIGGWITGIIFLIIEQKNALVRFHAAQSIIVFGSLTVLGSVLGLLPWVGHTFGTIIGIATFIFWVVLIVKALNGEILRLGVVTELAEKMVGPGVSFDPASYKQEPAEGQKSDQTQKPEQEKPAAEKAAAAAQPPVNFDKEIGKKVEEYFTRKRSGRVAASAFTIAFSIVALIFFNYFHDYVAYYSSDSVGNILTWTRTPFFTDDISLWLPVLTAALMASIIGHVIIIIFDRYVLREFILMVIEVFSLISAITLVTVFPFNFNVIPDAGIAEMVDLIVRIVLICVSVGIGIGIIVKLIKLVVNLVQGKTSYDTIDR